MQGPGLVSISTFCRRRVSAALGAPALGVSAAVRAGEAVRWRERADRQSWDSFTACPDGNFAR